MAQATLGFWALVALVVGNLVGSGIFLFPAALAPYGSCSFIGWGLTTLGAVLWALMFGRLSVLCPTMGGPHIYVRQAWGAKAAFVTAWSYWIMAWVSNVALVVATTSYALHQMPENPWINLMLQWGILLSCTIVHYRSLTCSGALESLLSLLKVVCLGVLPLWAICTHSLSWPPLQPMAPMGLESAIHQVALLAVWTYIGLETGTVPSGSSSRHVQKALIVGTLIAAAIYIMGCGAIMGIVPQAELAASKAPYADLAARVFGEAWGRPLITLVAVVSCLGALNGWVLVVGYMGYSAGQEGLFPPLFKQTNVRGVPVNSFVVATLCSMALMGLALIQNLQAQFMFLVDASVNLVLIIYAACALSLCKMAKRKSDYVLGIIGFVFACAVLQASSLTMFMGCLALMGFGYLIGYRRNGWIST